jgi:hypothetical protein
MSYMVKSEDAERHTLLLEEARARQEAALDAAREEFNTKIARINAQYGEEYAAANRWLESREIK